MRRFADVLKERELSRRLGDVLLTFDSPLLVGEAERPAASWWPAGLMGVAVCSGLAAVAWLVVEPSPWLGAGLLIAAWGAAWGSWRTLRAERARRRFVFDFFTHTLHFEGPASVWRAVRRFAVPFDAVCGVVVLEQPDGRACLTVDVRGVEDGERVLRELLVAHVRPVERSRLERLERQLKDALGAGLAPVSDGAGVRGPGGDADEVFDSFEPHDAAVR